MRAHFTAWQTPTASQLKALEPGFNPKALIETLSEELLAHYDGQALISHYAVYQHLMDYWDETMQDDAYLIGADGWVAQTTRIIEKDKKGKEKDKGWTCDLIPKSLIVARYFSAEQQLDALASELETYNAQLSELEEEHSSEDGAFGEWDKINKAVVTARYQELSGSARNAKPGNAKPGSARPQLGKKAEPGLGAPSTSSDECLVLKQWLELTKSIAAHKKLIRRLRRLKGFGLVHVPSRKSAKSSEAGG